jgi:hypothetical protein
VVGLRQFVGTVAGAEAGDRDGGWLGGPRDYIADAGLVPGSRFG